MTSTRRPMGSLEENVMRYLWAVGVGTPAEVHQAIAPELAYTTVTTVLSRLLEKNRIERSRRGRSFVYAPRQSEAEHRAGAMSTTLSAAADRSAVLSNFVDSLDPGDLDVLRELLDEET